MHAANEHGPAKVHMFLPAKRLNRVFPGLRGGNGSTEESFTLFQTKGKSGMSSKHASELKEKPNNHCRCPTFEGPRVSKALCKG